MENRDDPKSLLAGRVALVTGASRGIGAAIARRLAAAGATVVGVARGDDALRETEAVIAADGGSFIALAADIGDSAGLAGLPADAARLAGRLDILVNNAGAASYAPFGEMAADALDAMYRAYLRAPFLLSQASAPLMRENGAGWIVNIGSITALAPPRPFDQRSLDGQDAFYAALKAGLVRLTMGLAANLVRDNIAVNLAAPSTAIRTPGADALLPETYPTERPEYLAETVLDLCHRPAAKWTGLTAFSLHYPAAHGLAVRSLDGKEGLPAPEAPTWRHPATPALGSELSPAAAS